MGRFLSIFLITLFSVSAFAQKNTNSLEFVENKGQWDQRVKFMGELDNGAFFLRSNGFTILQHNPADLAKFDSHLSAAHGNEQPGGQGGSGGGGKTYRKAATAVDEDKITLRSHAYTVELKGGNPAPLISGDKQLPGYNNYMLGDDRSKWAGGCRIYGAVVYKDVYPNIDMRFYTEEGWVKYEFIVRPGGDPSSIVLEYKGTDKLAVKKGELMVGTSVGTVTELNPYTYQTSGKGRTEVSNRYQVKGNTVRFSLGSYDPQQLLVIDPTLIFSTFTKSRSDNWGYTATYGPDGTLYSGGIVFGSGFPVSDGAFQEDYRGSAGTSPFNMGIMKFDPLGTNRVYATYIGGKESDQPHSLIVNNRGNLIIAGRTHSPDYPVTVPANTYGPQGSWDIVLTELNPAGTALVGSIRIGGGGDDGLNTANSHQGGTHGLINFYGDDARSEVIIDGGGNIYLASCTQSDNFYTTANAPNRSLSGEQDGVLIKTNPDLSNVLMSTYFGGSKRDAAFVVGINPLDGDIYIAGSTESDDLPGSHAGTVGSSYQGGETDGFIAVFPGNGTSVKKSTYIGTNQRDAVLGFEFDRFGDPYTMGITFGNMPKINAVYGTDNARQFVGKLKKDLSDWQYRTTFGTAQGKPNISPVAFLVDRCQNVYVSGWGGTNLGSFNMQGTFGMQVTPDAIKKTTDGNDFYFIVIKRDATELLYASFFGQNGDLSEHVDGGTSRYDQNGVIYQAICANCFTGSNPRPRFPVTPGAWCCSNGFSGAYDPSGNGNGAQCNLAAVKIHFNFAGVGSGVASYINGVRDTMGCVPLTVLLKDTIRNAKTYVWSFGDGSPDVKTTDGQIQHTYNNVGLFRVRLISIDSNTCNIADTSYIHVKVSAAEAQLDFTGAKQLPCESLTFKFTNLSTPPAGYSFTDSSFLWDFGDGTTLITGVQPVVHSFASAGSYQVRMVLRDTIFCNVDDAIIKEYYLSPLVKADFIIPNGCAPYNAIITNTSIAGMTWLWDFGDGTTSTEKTPVKIFNNAGTYQVTLTATDPNTCNVTDRITKSVLVQDKPTAAFTYAPVVPVENTPHIFTNTSSPDAISFNWSFGDGETQATTSRAQVEHQYNSSGRFDVCLEATNASGCVDTVCQPVEAIVVPRIDLPNAFTPLGNAPNNIFYVKGFGISKMRFMIYNRFGQKVFESHTVKGGWDGRYNGVVQPMDVYAYVLEVEFIDGTRTTKKGDITLIR
ncbi:T9SS C-terminal target domain-containing protein [Flavihumibacter petaseus]|uniref:PKD domain-containing protein n=1 Tax=Flavihumibacter petaseus NBRC 106054 TaxID=1220578 RepID=A0A0E9MUZ9_9BACT|nr:T9SS C-terminal target domain-containing protein [Flavihumibacter petaseus]GAO41328.1 hypothetical protein FPE01S_01_03400 [Flavihumibacter petaseus NBRC 106054]